jgi:molecular chaperone Hsp33
MRLNFTRAPVTTAPMKIHSTPSGDMPPSPNSPQPAADDVVLPFQTIASGVLGRVVRLGNVVDTILQKHAYAEPVSHALGEALALGALLGAALKFNGRFILQTKSDGPLGFLVVNYDVPGKLRGYANVQKDRVEELSLLARGDQGRLIGHGHLAMTIDPGGDMERYQGIVALEGEPLVAAAHTYFRQSEQLPTFMRLAVARHFAGGRWSWRAGGLLIQHVARTGGNATLTDIDEDRDQRLNGEDDEAWTRARLLAETVQDHELLDPLLAPETLLYRVFHEEGVRVSPTVHLSAQCRCSREHIFGFLTQFGPAELADMREPDGTVSVTCEFCSTRYAFEPAEVGLTGTHPPNESIQR